MQTMVWIGVVMSVAGLAGVIWCIRKATWLKRTELEAGQVRSELNRLIFAHMASVGVAFLGLGLLMVGAIMT